MLHENIIGKEVWKLEPKGGTCICVTDKTYKVVANVEPGHKLPDGRTNNDWCDHHILFDGTTQTDVREFEVVVIPNTKIKDDTSRLNTYLNDNALHPADCRATEQGGAMITIEWGDWKHDHGWCDCLMRYLGYEKLQESLTRQNGSDCYSSIHFYKK